MSEFALTIKRPGGKLFETEASGPCTAAELAGAFRKHRIDVVAVTDLGTGEVWPPPPLPASPVVVVPAGPKYTPIPIPPRPRPQPYVPPPPKQPAPGPWWVRLFCWCLWACWAACKWLVVTAFTVPEECREDHPSNRRKARAHRPRLRR